MIDTIFHHEYTHPARAVNRGNHDELRWLRQALHCPARPPARNAGEALQNGVDAWHTAGQEGAGTCTDPNVVQLDVAYTL